MIYSGVSGRPERLCGDAASLHLCQLNSVQTVKAWNLPPAKSMAQVIGNWGRDEMV